MQITTHNISLLKGMLEESPSESSSFSSTLASLQKVKEPELDWSTNGKSFPFDWSKDGWQKGNTTLFNGRVEDYDIYLKKNAIGYIEVSVSRRGNNGFPDKNRQGAIPASDGKINVQPNTDIRFLGQGGSRIGLGGLAISHAALTRYGAGLAFGETTRLSLASIYSPTSTLYRANPNQQDYVLGGKGNDQFRVGESGIVTTGKYIDFFDGGEGTDTVYLQGNADRYQVGSVYKGQKPENSFLYHYIFDTQTKQAMAVLDVERLRFSQGEKGGYVSFASMLKTNNGGDEFVE
jgi:hypothetical protein